MIRDFSIRVYVFFAFVLLGAFIPFFFLGFVYYFKGEGWGGVLRDVLQSGELMVISTGLAAGAAGDLLVSTLQDREKRPRGLVIANFGAAYVFLMCAAFLYAEVAGARPAQTLATKLVTVMSVTTFALSIAIVLSTMWARRGPIPPFACRKGEANTGCLAPPRPSSFMGPKSGQTVISR